MSLEFTNFAKIKCTTETVGQRKSVLTKDILCRCAYSQEILLNFFARKNAPFKLRNVAKIRYSTETACH